MTKWVSNDDYDDDNGEGRRKKENIAASSLESSRGTRQTPPSIQSTFQTLFRQGTCCCASDRRSCFNRSSNHRNISRCPSMPEPSVDSGARAAVGSSWEPFMGGLNWLAADSMVLTMVLQPLQHTKVSCGHMWLNFVSNKYNMASRDPIGCKESICIFSFNLV